MDSNQDAGAKKPKTTTHTASGNDSEVLSLIMTKERLAKTTASVLRGSKVHVGSIIEASNTGRDALPISQKQADCSVQQHSLTTPCFTFDTLI